jgi:hypothetical protein
MENVDLTKEEKIKKEIRRLTSLFTELDVKTKKAVKSLIENAAFMSHLAGPTGYAKRKRRYGRVSERRQSARH